MTLFLDPLLMEEIWQAAERHYPLEGAGVMLGIERDGDRYVVDILEMENQFDRDQQHHRYQIDPLALLDAEEQAERQDLQLLGIFHSHPDHPPVASEYDRQMALPWYSYLITSVQGGKAIESRVWRLDDRTSSMLEEALQILEEGATAHR